jgi:hypothetical protein
MSIPVSNENALKALNLSKLSGKTAVENLLDAHSPSVLITLQNYTLDENYTAALAETSTPLATRYELAYSLLLLSSTYEFFNLNTAGNGIIQSTGMDAGKAQLLSAATVEKQKKALELRALRALEPYLSTAGKRRLVQLSDSRKSKAKAGLLCEETTTETTNWWEAGYDESLWGDL